MEICEIRKLLQLYNCTCGQLKKRKTLFLNILPEGNMLSWYNFEKFK